MDKLVNAIHALSGSEQDLKNLKATLNKEEQVITKHLNVLDDVLAALDPAAFSLGYAYILYCYRREFALISLQGGKGRSTQTRSQQICSGGSALSLDLYFSNSPRPP